MNIMISTNRKFLPYSYTMLYSLFSTHQDDPIDIWLLYSELTIDDINDLERFVGNYPSKTLHPLQISGDFASRVTARNGISIETFYRILAIDLLPADMDRILHLDVDLIVKGEIKSLYETDLKSNVFAACEDIIGILNGFHGANKRRMDIPDRYTYFNAGVLLMNLKLLRNENAATTMTERIYANNARYEYNDQDVMNELYYDRVRIAGWDIYNCPPAWFYLDKQAMEKGQVKFATYDEIKSYAGQPDGELRMKEAYINMTQQIYDQAHIIHYMGDTKPWSNTRGDAAVYKIFDRAYNETLGLREQVN